MTVVTATTMVVAAAGAFAQRRRPGRGRPAAGGLVVLSEGAGSRTITIPVVEAAAMAQRQRVFLFTPPPGSSAYGIGVLGSGRRVWALLPSCRQPNPDDPRDPCPVGHVSMEVPGGGPNSRVNAGEPQTIGTSPDARRVQSFVVPTEVQTIRVKIHRRDGAVRWEAAIDATQLGTLPTPEGTPRGPDAFAFNLQRYPAL
jgi:hypothetical protein